MKKIQFLCVFTICAVLFAFAVNATAQAGGAGSATVVRAEGIVSYSLGDDKWIPLVAGKVLPVGAIIRTDYNGVADIVLGKDIQLPDKGSQGRWAPQHTVSAGGSGSGAIDYRSPSTEQNVIRVTPDTTLGITRITVTDTGADTVSDTELDLKKGNIYASVKKLTGASQYFIKLPNGIAGVRGTQFSISADGVTTVYHSTGGGVVVSLVGTEGLPTTTIVAPNYTFNPTTKELTITAPGLKNVVENVFSALRTIYPAVTFTETKDGTCIYISPTHGVK